MVTVIAWSPSLRAIEATWTSKTETWRSFRSSSVAITRTVSVASVEMTSACPVGIARRVERDAEKPRPVTNPGANDRGVFADAPGKHQLVGPTSAMPLT